MSSSRRGPKRCVSRAEVRSRFQEVAWSTVLSIVCAEGAGLEWLVIFFQPLLVLQREARQIVSPRHQTAPSLFLNHGSTGCREREGQPPSPAQRGERACINP